MRKVNYNRSIGNYCSIYRTEILCSPVASGELFLIFRFIMRGIKLVGFSFNNNGLCLSLIVLDRQIGAMYFFTYVSQRDYPQFEIDYGSDHSNI